jgi:hypothetical protein
VADHVGVVDVVGGEVGQGAVTAILRLDQHGSSAGSCRAAGVDRFPGLHAGRLIGGEDVVVVAEFDPVMDSGVQVEHSSGLEREVGVARKDPGPVLPGSDRVGGQPAPHR